MLKIEITNKDLAVINANKSMQFVCPNCYFNLIELDISTKEEKFTHNYCPHCGAKINWNLSR